MAAAWAYLDTSALLRRYVRGPGSPRVVAFLRRGRWLSSAVAPIEILSALGRRRASGDLAERDLRAATARMMGDRVRWELVGATSLVLARAEPFVRGHGLSPLAAVHLASALTFQDETGSRVSFVTSEPRQRAVAERCGLPVVWVA